jgi:hypothetical protein
LARRRTGALDRRGELRRAGGVVVLTGLGFLIVRQIETRVVGEE